MMSDKIIMSNFNWAIVGDIHSQSSKLELALNYCKDNKLRPIFLGDIFDSQIQESDSLGVYKLLKDAQIELNAIILQSNHQDKLIRYLQGNPVNTNNGLPSTIIDFGLNFSPKIDRDELLNWLLSMPYAVIFKDYNKNQYRASHAYFPKQLSAIVENLYDLNVENLIEFHEKDFYETQKFHVEFSIDNVPIKTFKKIKERLIYGPTTYIKEEKSRVLWWEKKTHKNWTSVVGHYGLVLVNLDNKVIILDGGCGKDGGSLPLYHLNEKKLLMF